MKYAVITTINYNGCTVKRVGDVYYWGKWYGEFEYIKSVIDGYVKKLQTT